MRTHRFPVVHLNDSPLLAAAMVSHRNGAKVVWHLRSALAGEGRDRRSRAIAAMMERWGDAAIAIDRDVAERFPIRLPLTIVHNSVEPPVSRNGAGKSALGLPPDRVAIGFAGLRPPPEGLARARRGRRHPRARGRAGALRDHGRRRPPAGVLPHAARPRARGDEPADRRGVGDQGAREREAPRPELLVPAVHRRHRRDLQRARRRHVPEPGRRPRPPGARGGDVRQAGRRVGLARRRGDPPAGPDGVPARRRAPGADRRARCAS